MHGRRDARPFVGVRYVERLGRFASVVDEHESAQPRGDGLGVVHEVQPVMRMAGKLLECAVGALLMVLSLQMKAEVGGMGEELGVDGEGGIGHERWLGRGRPPAFAQVAVGEGEGELALVAQDVGAGSGALRGGGPAGALRLPALVQHEVSHNKIMCPLHFY